MADWSNSSGNKIRPYRSALGPPIIRHLEESTAASSAVVNRGDVVTSDTVVTTGGLRIVRAPSSGGNGTNVMQVAITSLIGVALQASTGDGSTTGITANGLGKDNNRKIAVALAHPQQEFIGYTSTLEGGNGVASNLFVGVNRPLVYDRNLHTFFVASTNSTAALAAVTITEVPQDVYGDSGGWPVIFKFLSTNLSPIVGGGVQ
jgi:hypothetical protein